MVFEGELAVGDGEDYRGGAGGVGCVGGAGAGCGGVRDGGGGDEGREEEVEEEGGDRAGREGAGSVSHCLRHGRFWRGVGGRWMCASAGRGRQRTGAVGLKDAMVSVQRSSVNSCIYLWEKAMNTGGGLPCSYISRNRH